MMDAFGYLVVKYVINGQTNEIGFSGKMCGAVRRRKKRREDEWEGGGEG